MVKLQLLRSVCITAVSVLIAQPAFAQVVQVTAVELKSTANGLEVNLTTADSKPLQVFTSSYRQTFVANILNTQLALPQGTSFRRVNPIAGIAAVSVTQQGANSIRVIVLGTAALPTAEVVRGDRSLVLNLTPPASRTAQQPTPKPQVPEAVEPDSQTQSQGDPAPELEGATESPETTQPEVEAEGEELEIVVTGEQETGYSVPDATTATKTDTPLRDIPQSIQVIPRQLLEDRQVTRLEQIADNVPGVQQSPYALSPTGANFFIRGFGTDSTTYRDGFRDFRFFQTIDLANIERVEILKGPTSVLYGQNDPGGLVNLVSKLPLSEPYYALSGTIGSYDFYRPTLDISSPLNADGTIAYRLNLAYENSGSFRDNVELDKFFVAPALSWQIGKNTNLTFQFEYQDLEFVIDRGLPAVSQAFQVPIGRFIGEPDINNQTNKVGRGSYILEHQFSENWKLRHGFSANFSEYELSEVSAGSVQEDGRTLEREYYTGTESAATYALQNELVGRFNTGSVAHQLLLGVEFYSQRDRYKYFGALIDPIDFFDPVYGAKPFGEQTRISGDEIGADGISLYVQDQVTLSQQWKLLVGGRFDWVHTIDRSLLPDNYGTYITDERDFAISPRAGIVYQPIEPISLYLSYATSFKPLVFGGFSITQEPLKPERGQQLEVGIKADLLRDRLFATFAAYQIKKKNALATDPNNPLFSIQTGEQTSKGFEFSLIGRPLAGWETSLGYAYTDAFVSEDTQIPIGDQLAGVPKHQVGLLNTYEIQNGSLKGLGFNLGLYYVNEREAVLPNTEVKVPDYFRVDAGIFYRRNNWKLQLNVNNLTNIDYYNTDGYAIFPQPPLTVLGTVAVEF